MKRTFKSFALVIISAFLANANASPRSGIGIIGNGGGGNRTTVNEKITRVNKDGGLEIINPDEKSKGGYFSAPGFGTILATATSLSYSGQLRNFVQNFPEVGVESCPDDEEYWFPKLTDEVKTLVTFGQSVSAFNLPIPFVDK